MIAPFPRISAQKLFYGYTERIDIRPLVRLGKPVLLGRRIPSRAKLYGVLFRIFLRHPRRVKIDQTDMPVLCNQYVGGLDIPVDDPLSMQENQRVAKLPHNHKTLFFRKRCAARRSPLNILLHNNRAAALKSNLIYHRQIWVSQFPQSRVYLMSALQNFPHEKTFTALLFHKLHRTFLTLSQQLYLIVNHI